MVRLFILWLVYSLATGTVSAQTQITPDPVGDTTLLPYDASYFIESGFPADQQTSAHTIRIVQPQTTPADSILAVLVTNSSAHSDDAASVFVNKLPDNRTLSQDPVFLTIKDFCLFRDSTDRLGVAIVGFRNDSAYVVRNFPGTNRFDFLFLASGVDATGNGRWEPSPYHLAAFDYDYDGTTELFFYLMCGRDKRPRIYFCVDIERMVIEWSLPMSASATQFNTVNCFDSVDPGILVGSYGPENGVSDPNFDDQYGYLTRIDRHGNLIFNFRIAPKFANPAIRVLPGDSLYVLYHEYSLPDQARTSDAAWLSIIDAQGRSRKSVAVPPKLASLDLVDLVGDDGPELLMVGNDGNAMIFDLELTVLGRISGARLGRFLATFRLPKSGEVVLQFVTEGGSILYSKDWECRGVLPGIGNELIPAEIDSTGGLSMFVANAGNGFVAGNLHVRPWSQRLVAVLWRYRTWFVVALILLSLQLVVVNVRRRRAIEALRKADARNEAILNATPDLMFRLTADGHFIDYQASRQSELYAPAEQFLNRNVSDVLPAPLAQRLVMALAEALESGASRTLEYQLPIQGILRDYEARLVVAGKNEVLAIVRDFTDQKQTVKALAESERNFRMFFETIGDMLIVASRDGRVLFTNSTMRTKLGYTSEEITALQLVELHPPEVREEAIRTIDAILRGETQVCTLPLLMKDGTRIEASTRVWEGTWNGAECIFGLSKDLTEKEEAEQRFHRVFEANPSLMAVTESESGRFVDINSAFLQTLGYSRAELIGHTAPELKMFVNHELHKAAGIRLIEEGHVRDVELLVRHKDGHILTGRFAGEIIRSAGKNYFLTVMIDVTSERRAVEELRRSREFLAIVLDSIPARVFWKDLQGRYLGCNTQFARDAGFASPNEVIGKDDFAMGWRDQGELYRADDRAVIESGQPKMLIEEPQTTPTGETISLLTSKVPLRDLDGTIVGVLGAYQDVTEMKRAEKALRESEEKYRSLSEHSNIGILQYNDFRVLYANEQLARMLEIDVAELTSMSMQTLLETLVGYEATQAWLDRIRRRMAGGDAPAQFETEITTFKGTHKRLQALARRIVLPDRTFVQATWLDITVRHQIEQSLRESESRFRAVAESMSAGITIFGKDRLLYCNPASCHISGYSAEELASMNYWDIIHPQFRELAMQRGRERLTGADVPPRYEIKIIRKDGEERWIDYSAQVIKFMGETCNLGTTIDITDRVKAESELQRVYQERYQQVREIAGGVSHEIYNSLFPATTSLHKMRERMSQRTLEPEEKERDLRLLGLAEQAIARAIHMTESVTRYSRLEANRRIEDISVKNVIGEIIEQNRSRFESGHIQVVASIPTNAHVACSRPHFNSLVNNLVVNAIDALQETAQPTISITAQLSPQTVSIRVADNGSGISAEDLPRIFDAFFSTKPRSGTGIGLAMARKIAEMYGGTLRVSSTPNSGTNFEITLPRYRAEEEIKHATQ